MRHEPEFPVTCECPGEDEHTCPFQEDVNDDSEFTCNCCALCQYNCAMDI